MFRENVLTNDAIIDRIASTMVPIAVDRWKAEDPETDEAKFLLPFLKRHPPQGSPCIYAPDGKILGAFRGYGDMAGRTKKLIEESLRAFGPVAPRKVAAAETHPYRGHGVRSDGSVCLAAFIRPSGDARAYLNTRTPVVSSVTLSAEELAALAPARLEVSARWTLPNTVARKFARITSPLCYQHAPAPDWVTAVRIDGEVRAIAGGTARLGYEGRIASEHRVAGRIISVQKIAFSGEGDFALETKTMRSLLLVGTGKLRWPETPEKLVSFDALVEWSRDEASGALRE